MKRLRCESLKDLKGEKETKHKSEPLGEGPMKKTNHGIKVFFENLSSLDAKTRADLNAEVMASHSEKGGVTRFLLDCLKHNEFEIIMAAGIALGDLVDSSHMWELIGLTMEENPNTSIWATKLLGKIDDDSIVATLFTIFEETKDFRVLNTIGRMGRPSVVAKLGEYVDGDESSLRFHAMQMLVELRHPAANGEFIKALNHDNFEIICSAATGLGFVGDSSAVPALIEAFEKRNAMLPKIAGTSNPNPVMTFGIHGNYSSQYLSMQGSPIIGSPVMEIAYALGKIGDKRAVPVLLEAAKTSPHVQVQTECVGALAKIGGVESSFFIERLDSKFSKGVRNHAKKALRKIECLPELYTAFLESERSIRETVGKIINLIAASIETAEDIGEFFVHWDMAIEKNQRAMIADDLTGDEIKSMNRMICTSVKMKEERLLSVQKEKMGEN